MTNLLPSSRLALPGYCVRNMGLPNGLSAVGKTMSLSWGGQILVTVPDHV